MMVTGFIHSVIHSLSHKHLLTTYLCYIWNCARLRGYRSAKFLFLSLEKMVVTLCCGEGSSEHWGRFSSILGVYPLDARNTLIVTTKYLNITE